MTTTTETTEYLYITDAGHGWLKVPLAELLKLGIADKISSYSYAGSFYRVDGTYVR